MDMEERRVFSTCLYPNRNLPVCILPLASASFTSFFFKLSDDVVDQDSRFAKSLGFYEDAPWNLNYNASGSERIDGNFADVIIIYTFFSFRSLFTHLPSPCREDP